MEQELVGMWAQAGVGVGQLALIAWGLRQMSQASADRNRQLDIMEARQEAQSQARQLHPGYAELPGRFGHRDSSALEDAVLKRCPWMGGVNMRLIRASLPIVAHNSVYDGWARHRHTRLVFRALSFSCRRPAPDLI